MIQQVFVILDTKADAFGTPFFQHTVGLAMRACADLVRDPSTVVHRHPEDFVLFRLGTYNDQNATFETGTPENLGSLSTLNQGG